MDLITLSIILTIHFVADFILQSNYVAQNKSKSNWVLAQHVLIYGLPFAIFIDISFALINTVLHFIVDYFTSRISGRLWQAGQVHNFFVVIGFDQLLHALSLIWTYKLLIG